MKIDVNGTYVEELDNLLTEESKTSIRDLAIRTYGAFNDLTIGRWVECMHGDFSRVLGDITGSWLQIYWLRAFKEFCEEFPKTLERLSPKMDNDEQRACEGLMQSTLIESLLVFTRNYFGLHSFNEAQEITLGEVLIAKKASYNDAVFRKMLAKIQLEKTKRR